MKRAAREEKSYYGAFRKRAKLEIVKNEPIDSSPPRDESKVFTEQTRTPKENISDCKTRISAAWGKSYEILHQIGTGVFGKVYLVSDEEKENKFAIKILQTARRDVFDNEVQIMKKISVANHENLVNLLQSGEVTEAAEECSKFAILMDVYGPSIFTVMADAKSKKPNQILAFTTFDINIVGLQIAEAMKHLARIEIFHLDLKPENVLFSSPQIKIDLIDEENVSTIQLSDLRVRVGDFGSAGSYQEFRNKHKRAKFIQTQNYRAPEVIMGLPLSEKSDVWSFACILIEMYIGDLLFYGNLHNDSEQVQFAQMQKVLNQHPSPRMWKEAILLKSDKVESSADGIVQMKGSVSDGNLLDKPLFAHLRPNDIEGANLFIFLRSIFEFDPENRPSFHEIAAHEFFIEKKP